MTTDNEAEKDNEYVDPEAHAQLSRQVDAARPRTVREMAGEGAPRLEDFGWSESKLERWREDARLQSIETIAQASHEVNRAYCERLGDHSQPHWEAAPEWQRESVRQGVRGILEGRITTPQESHESWLEHKLRAGWKYGPAKDVGKREHPCIVPYALLREEQRAKGDLCHGVVGVLGRLLGEQDRALSAMTDISSR